MNTTDPIADMLTRIRNANSSKHKTVDVPASNMKRAITLKENKCYFESNVDESESYEMIKSFLNHINIKLSACKVLLSYSTTKPNESYITFVL